MIRDWGFREIVAVILMGMFAWLMAKNPTDPIIVGAVLTAFAAAWGFYLGGSKVGTDTATSNAKTVSDQARANSPAIDPDEPAQVEVINTTANPVPTTEGDAP